jgi:hypothetical protein
MTFEQKWKAIQQLCPAAEFKPGDHIGKTYVFLPGISYSGAGAMCVIAPGAGRNHEEAAAKCWEKLIELNASDPLYRDLGPGQTLSGRRYQLLRWDGTNWVGVGFDE